MNTTPFLARVAVCFGISWLPLREFENQIYATRLYWENKPLPLMPLAPIPKLLVQAYSFPTPSIAAWLTTGVLMLGLILGAALAVIYYPVLISSLAIAGTGLLVAGIGLQLIFHFTGFYVPSANIFASLLVTYLVFTGYRLAFQENLQWRALKRAQYLRELEQMKANFVSLLSHDLKTPLAKIQATVDRLRREPQLLNDHLDSLENSNSELKKAISSILSLSKIEANRITLNRKSNDINRIIQETLKRMTPLARHKNIRFEENLEPLFAVECDEDLVKQVFTNLLDNAIKFSPSESSVVVRSLEEEGYVRVDVEDFGPGIPKDQLPLMFRKFSQLVRPAASSMTGKVKGSGLGLYLSKYFIELHGGSIRVKTQEGKGTTFSFKLPVQSS